MKSRGAGHKQRIQSKKTGQQRESDFFENDSWRKEVLACRKSKAESTSLSTPPGLLKIRSIPVT